MRARMLDRTVSRFIATSYEQADPACYIDKLDVLEAWEQFRADNASGHVVDAKSVIEKFSEIFPGCKMSEYRINGVSKRPPKPGKVRREFTDEEWREMQWRDRMDHKWRRWYNSLSVYSKTNPFKAEWFANDRQTTPTGIICSECSIEDATKYLSSLEYLYFDQSDNMWHFHNREVPSF